MIKPVFIGNFSNADDVKSNFCVSNEKFKGVKILFAYYTHEDYSGSAFVLFKKGRKFYEVNGSHCSCYGLEDQWSPEVIEKKELIERAKKNSTTDYYSLYYLDLYKFLKKNEKEIK